jgi:hypothetical protein
MFHETTIGHALFPRVYPVLQDGATRVVYAEYKAGVQANESGIA